MSGQTYPSDPANDPFAAHPAAYNALLRLLQENQTLRTKNDELIKENGELRANGKTTAQIELSAKWEKKIGNMINALQQLKNPLEAGK